MRAIEFPQHNTVYAKHQPEYIPLPVYRTADGEITACFKLSWQERLKLFFTGEFWLTVLTFNKPLQPVHPSVDNPFTTKIGMWESLLRALQTDPLSE